MAGPGIEPGKTLLTALNDQYLNSVAATIMMSIIIIIIIIMIRMRTSFRFPVIVSFTAGHVISNIIISRTPSFLIIIIAITIAWPANVS